MLTVPDAARVAGRDPETVRRWIRTGKLRASKVGTQHVIDEADLATALEEHAAVAIPERLRRFESGRPQPDWSAILRRSRGQH
jgi:excisionase family DNA binding protein